MCILFYLITVQVLDYVWRLVLQQGTWIILQRYHFTCIDNIWRIRNKMEIDKLIESADIVRFIKVQRIK